MNNWFPLGVKRFLNLGFLMQEMYHPRKTWESILVLTLFVGILTGGEKANVIYILADDLGYGEVGYQGQEKIKTPRLDDLATKGMTFTSHYCGNSVCAPSRCSLMTGKHPGHAYIRANSPGYPGGQTPLPEGTETLGTLMKRAGYKTGIIGKWGLGGVWPNGIRTSGVPEKQGFDHFFGFLDQRRAHNYYPDYLWRNSKKVPMNQKGQRDYAHDKMTEEAISFIKGHHKSPFFLYLAYLIPHIQYQVPSLGQYKDKNWPKEMKIHAAMTTRMDRDIGKIVDLLVSLGISENTLLIFNSDNGAHGKSNSSQFLKTSGELRGLKRSMYEGGVRSPMLAYWPGTIKPGQRSDHISLFGTCCRHFLS